MPGSDILGIHKSILRRSLHHKGHLNIMPNIVVIILNGNIENYQTI